MLAFHRILIFENRSSFGYQTMHFKNKTQQKMKGCRNKKAHVRQNQASDESHQASDGPDQASDPGDQASDVQTIKTVKNFEIRILRIRRLTSLSVV